MSTSPPPHAWDGGHGGPAAPLTHSYQVYHHHDPPAAPGGTTTFEIRSLVVGVDYVFAVDAVNSNGVAVGTARGEGPPTRPGAPR